MKSELELAIQACQELAEFGGDTGTGDYVEDRLRCIPVVLARLAELESPTKNAES